MHGYNHKSRGITTVYNIIHMDYYQNNDLITTKKSNQVSEDKMFSKQEYFYSNM